MNIHTLHVKVHETRPEKSMHVAKHDDGSMVVALVSGLLWAESWLCHDLYIFLERTLCSDVVFTQVVAGASAAPCVSAPRASARGFSAPSCGGHCRRDGQWEKHPNPPIHPGGDAGKRGGENTAV